MNKPVWAEGCYYSLIRYVKHSSFFFIALPSSLAIVTLFLCFGFSHSLVSIPLLLLSTIFIVSFSNGKPVKEKEEAVEKLKQDQFETMMGSEKKEACELLLDEYQVESTDFPSDGESSSDDSPRNEGFQLNWKMPFNNVIINQSLPLCETAEEEEAEESDDGDHLIEISLPTIESISTNADQVSKPKWGMQQEEEEEEGMMEEMDEANEEDNLIEIDLSIGSIKYSNFDLEN